MKPSMSHLPNPRFGHSAESEKSDVASIRLYMLRLLNSFGLDVYDPSFLHGVFQKQKLIAPLFIKSSLYTHTSSSHFVRFTVVHANKNSCPKMNCTLIVFVNNARTRTIHTASALTAFLK